MARILLIDDDASLREVLAYTLREQGHEVETAADGSAGLVLLERAVPDAVITDLKMPGIDGLEVLRRAHEIDATLPVIVLTAFGSIEDAVAAMRDGAHDYLTKPYNRDELRLTVEKALEKRRLVQENRTLRDRLREERRRMPLVHVSPAMERVVAAIRRLAPTDATVLITGESGTGKELVAQSLHDLSDRWDGPFVAINCAAIPHDLMESELFGHERGAFTGAVREKPGKFRQAHGGTLLLDEVADLAGRPADEAPARHRDAPGRSGRRHASRAGRRAHRGGDERRSRGAGGGGTLPRGPLLPAECDPDPPPPAARAAGGHPRAVGAVRRAVRRRA